MRFLVHNSSLYSGKKVVAIYPSTAINYLDPKGGASNG